MLTATPARISSDPAYHQFEKLIASRVAAIKGPLFTTNAAGLFDAYLNGLPPEDRQHYNCRCCQRFIERYGSLVHINEDGSGIPLLWNSLDDVPTYFHASVQGMRRNVEKSRVIGIFINDAKAWGTPFNVPEPPSKFQGVRWTHLSGEPSEVWKHPIKTASQVEAEKLQDFIMLKRGVEEIPMEAVVQAVRVLESDAVDRSEKTLGIAKWLLELHRSIADAKGNQRNNLIWLVVAKAPPGWCHVRSTMIATLLEDVVAGLPFDAIKQRWDAKMHPLRYQRPTTVKDGNIEQANKIVAKLQSEGSLQRRFARIEDAIALWKPRLEEKQDKSKTGGPFDHLRERSVIKPVELPALKITWEKFRETVLPTASEIEVNLPHGRVGYFGLVTAANADSPPILQWDGLEGFVRNPVSWYFYHSGSTAQDWSLVPGWNKVSAVCLKPCHWQKPDGFGHQGDGVFFIISAAKDMRAAGVGLFPECLRFEYHEIRHAVEAYSQRATIAGRDDGTANGIALNKGEMLTLRVHVDGTHTDYSVTLD